MAWTLIQCLRIEVKLKVSLARHEKAGSRAEAGVARLEGHSLKHREVLQLITVNRYGMVWYGVVLLDPIGSLYIGNIVIDSSKPPTPTKIATNFQMSVKLRSVHVGSCKFREIQVNLGKFR